MKAFKSRKQSRRDGVGRPLMAAACIIGLCMGGLLTWTMLAPMAGAVLAEGEIIVEGETKSVQHLEGGIVSEILVSDGERVVKGQPLLRLRTIEALANFASLEAERDTLAARAVRLGAEIEGTAQPDFDALLSRHTDTIDSAVASQLALFGARERERAAEQELIDGTLTRLTARRGAISAQLTSLQEQLSLVEEDAGATEILAERGVVTKAALRESQRSISSLRGSIASLEAQMAEAGASESELLLERAKTETGRLSAVSDELAGVQARLAEIKPAIDAEAERIDRGVVRAPVSGTIVGLSVATRGAVIAPGEPILRIVPESARLVVTARLRASDRDRLQDGMDAEVRFPGTRSRDDATVEGRIVRISADVVAGRTKGEETDPSGHYALVVNLAEHLDGVRLTPGMPVTVIVPTMPRTVIDYLLSPIRDAISRSMREV